MKNNYQVVLEPTTLATVSPVEFSAIVGNTSNLICSGLQGDEVIFLQVYCPFTDDFVDCPQSTITATSNPLFNGFLDAGLYRIRKTATVNPVGAALYQNISTSTIKLGGN